MMLDQEEGEQEVDDYGLLAENNNNVGAVDHPPKLTRDLVRKGLEEKKYEHNNGNILLNINTNKCLNRATQAAAAVGATAS